MSLTYNSSFARLGYRETHGQFQRVIESYWRRMTHNFTRVIQSTFQYGVLFTRIKLLVSYSFLSQICRLMENSGILNHESDVDIMCLHYVATPLIQDILSQSQSMWNLNILPAEDHHNACQLFQGDVVNVSDFQCPIPQAILSQFRNAIDVEDVTIENVSYYFSCLKRLITD